MIKLKLTDIQLDEETMRLLYRQLQNLSATLVAFAQAAERMQAAVGKAARLMDEVKPCDQKAGRPRARQAREAGAAVLSAAC